ncbi:hypothetical protein GQ53DRAFT_819120 [Thozetella sp. PMI_491]|nr:hypothetical protein GQ53DRAFT_819120 [Thozetella sp. PMI_491]
MGFPQSVSETFRMSSQKSGPPRLIKTTVNDWAATGDKWVRGKLQKFRRRTRPDLFSLLASGEKPNISSIGILTEGFQDGFTYPALQDPEKQSGTAATFSRQTTDNRSNLNIFLRFLTEIFPRVPEITPTSDFFDDLAGHSLDAAMLVSKLRNEYPVTPGLERLALQHVYANRTAERIVTALDNDDDLCDDSCDDESFDDEYRTQIEEHWPVSPRSYILCGLAQIPALFFLFFVQSVSLFTPFLVFYAILGIGTLGEALLATYLSFTITPLVINFVGVAGRWIVLGNAKRGEYPLYGIYYYRWWLAEQFVRLVDINAVADSPLLPILLRCMGARIGKHCHIGTTHVDAAVNLLTIRGDSVLGKHTILSTSWIERGRLVIAPIRIGSQTHIGSNSIVEGGTVIQEGGELRPMAMLPASSLVPAGERWGGSPARFQDYPSDVGNMRASRPSRGRVVLMTLATAFTWLFIFPMISFAPQIPTLFLFEYLAIPNVNPYAQIAIVSIPATLAYLIIVFVEIVALRWLVLGTIQEGSFRTMSVNFYRKWFVDRLMLHGLDNLDPLSGSLYALPFLRSLGVKIGRTPAVPRARNVRLSIMEIKHESFDTEKFLMADGEVRGHMVMLKKKRLNDPTGARQSAAEKQENRATNSPVPRRPQRCCSATQPCDLHSPHWTQIGLRLFIEGMRIVVPNTLVVFWLAICVEIFQAVSLQLDLVLTLILTPLIYLAFLAIPVLAVTILFKWLFVGRYRHAEWPLWTADVWRSEFVTSTYGMLVVPLLNEFLTGTPFLAAVFRLFGMRIGARTTLLSGGIAGYDMLSLGDEAVINRYAAVQTHMFEDCVMKVGRVDIESRACMKTHSRCVPNSRIAACQA